MRIVSKKQFEEFESDFMRAIGAADLKSKVDINLFWYSNKFLRDGHSVQLHSVMSFYMQQEQGARVMEILVEKADLHDIDIILWCPDQSDDFEDHEGIDPNHFPSENDLMRWFGRFGFEPLGDRSGDRRLARQSLQPVPHPGV
jgi:hypothetical protein